MSSIDLAPYRGLHGAELAQHSDIGTCFICEGRYLVEEAIRAAEQGMLRFVSLLCDSSQIEEWKDKTPHQARLLTLDTDELNSLVGFNFHRGVLCCCAVPEAPLETQLSQASRLLVLPHLDNVDNLGQLSRTAAALAIDGILIGRGPNPFARRCVRVSMGAVWKIPILKSNYPDHILDKWLQHCPNVKSEIVGTAATSNAEIFWEWMPAPRTALVLGAESHGLDSFWQTKCTKHIRIPLERQIDSLNISAAGAILMSKMNLIQGNNQQT
ncbi:MAG: RNA methyltransferase [Holophagales bacterium]|nr:RNA methyltransferase [Holophagales bacterium]